MIPTPDFPHFYYKLGGNLGSLLYRDVSVMFRSKLFGPLMVLSEKVDFENISKQQKKQLAKFPACKELSPFLV